MNYPGANEKDTRRVEEARVALNATPWWRPIKRQEAAERYKFALLLAALREIREGDR